MVLKAADQTGTDLTGWKMTTGGSALARALCGEARRRGMLSAAGYGMSETCPTVLKAARRTSVAFSDEDEMLSTFTASGISVPLVEARIVDELMKPLPPEEIGRAAGRDRGCQNV